MQVPRFIASVIIHLNRDVTLAVEDCSVLVVELPCTQSSQAIYKMENKVKHNNLEKVVWKQSVSTVKQSLCV